MPKYMRLSSELPLLLWPRVQIHGILGKDTRLVQKADVHPDRLVRLLSRGLGTIPSDTSTTDGGR